MAIRAVLFDLGDTVIKLHPMEGRIAERAGRILAAHHGKAAAGHAPGMAAKVDAALAEVSRMGGPREADLPGLWETELRTAGLDPALAGALAGLTGDEDIARFACPDSSVAALKRLHAMELRLVIVSNTLTEPARLDAYLESAGIRDLFAARLYSCALGWRKPAREIYEAALSAAGVHASEAAFVGDRMREDVVAPASLGMRAFLTHEHRQEAPGPEAHAVLPELGALVGHLERPN